MSKRVITEGDLVEQVRYYKKQGIDRHTAIKRAVEDGFDAIS